MRSHLKSEPAASRRTHQDVRCPWHVRGVACVHARASQQEADTRQQVHEEEQMPRINRYNTPSIARRAARPAVAEQPWNRPKPVEPEAVPVIHSSAYQQTLVQNRMSPMSSIEEESTQASASGRTGTVMVRSRRFPNAAHSDPSDESAIEWALRRADASLDELEANPTALQKAVYGISRGPVGTATTNAVQAAAKLTMQATVQAAKAAAPVGRWALAAGAKAAAQLIKAAVVQGAKAENRKADQKQKEKRNKK